MAIETVPASRSKSEQAAYDALCYGQVMATAIKRLLEELDVIGDPDKQPLAYALEACADKIEREATDALQQMDAQQA